MSLQTKTATLPLAGVRRGHVHAEENGTPPGFLPRALKITVDRLAVMNGWPESLICRDQQFGDAWQNTQRPAAGSKTIPLSRRSGTGRYVFRQARSGTHVAVGKSRGQEQRVGEWGHIVDADGKSAHRQDAE